MNSPADYVLMKRGRGPGKYSLRPTDPRSAEAIRAVPEGEEVGVRICRDRSLPMHNRYWKILTEVAKAAGFASTYSLHNTIKVNTGRFELIPVRLKSGKIKPAVVPHSTSFEAMTQGEFAQFYADAMGYITTEVIPGYDPDLLFVEEEAAESARLRHMLEASVAK